MKYIQKIKSGSFLGFQFFSKEEKASNIIHRVLKLHCFVDYKFMKLVLYGRYNKGRHNLENISYKSYLKSGNVNIYLIL